MSLAKVLKANENHGRSYPILSSGRSSSKPYCVPTGGIHTRTAASKANVSYTAVNTSVETNPLKMFDHSQISSYGAISAHDSASGRGRQTNSKLNKPTLRPETAEWARNELTLNR